MKVFQIRQDNRFAWYETSKEHMEDMVNKCNWQGRVLELAKDDSAQPMQQPAPAHAVHQFRTAGASDWYDGHPDSEDGGGPYEVRILYAAPVAAPVDVPAASVQPESSRERFETHIKERNPAASLNRHPNLHHLYALAWVNEAWLAWRKAANVQPITCQIYGHVVGHCGECNVGDEGAAQDAADTNKVLADNYVKQTCGTAASVQPFVPAGYANETEFLRQQLKDSRTANKAAQLVIAELQAGKPDSGRDAATLRERFEADVRAKCHSKENADAMLEMNANGFYIVQRVQYMWVGWEAANVAQPVSDAALEEQSFAWMAAQQLKGRAISDTLRKAYLEGLAAHPANVAQVGELSHDSIQQIFLASGFTIKEGQSDLKDYVYKAAYAILAAAKKEA